MRNLKFAAVPAALLALAGTASAEIPAAVTTALTGAATDVGTAYAALVAVAVVGVGFLIGIKMLKKAPRVA